MRFILKHNFVKRLSGSKSFRSRVRLPVKRFSLRLIAESEMFFSEIVSMAVQVLKII